MPKRPVRDNPQKRTLRTIQGAAEGAASLLQRISRRADVILSSESAGPGGASHIDVVRAALPETLRPHLSSCLLRPGELVLFTDAAVWATRLRLAACEAATAGAFASLLPGTAAAPRITVRVSAITNR